MLNDLDVCLICNDEGKLLKLPHNRDIGYDIIFGNFIVVGDDYKNGEFRSLSKEQLKKHKEKFNRQSIIDTDNKVLAIKLSKYIRR